LRRAFGGRLGAAYLIPGSSVAEWLVCWTQAQQAWVQIAATTLSGNSLRQTAHSHRASVHQAAKLVAALLRAARVSLTVGLAESNGSLPSGLCQEPRSAAEPYTLGNRVWATFTFTFFYLISQSPRTCCPGSGNEDALCALLTSQLAYPDRW